MLPLLAQSADHVLAADQDLGPLRKVTALLPLPGAVETLDLSERAVRELPADSCDIITALDVLEHVTDLEDTLDSLFRLLRPGGVLLVSGPTENMLYRIGRQLAGAEYTGAYHVRNIESIRKALTRHGSVRRLGTVMPLLPLFRLYLVTKPSLDSRCESGSASR